MKTKIHLHLCRIGERGWSTSYLLNLCYFTYFYGDISIWDKIYDCPFITFAIHDDELYHNPYDGSLVLHEDEFLEHKWKEMTSED